MVDLDMVASFTWISMPFVDDIRETVSYYKKCTLKTHHIDAYSAENIVVYLVVSSRLRSLAETQYSRRNIPQIIRSLRRNIIMKDYCLVIILKQ